MRRASGERVLFGTIFVSLGAHLVFVAVLPAYEGRRPRDDAFAAIEVSMDPIPEPVQVPDVEAPVVPPPPTTGALASSVLTPRPSIDVPQITPEVGPQPTSEPTVVTVPDSASPRPDTAAAPTTGTRLDPRAAALATLGTGGPVTLAPQAQDGPSETAAERDARISQALSAHLREVANFQAHLTTRPTPEPRTLPDGRVAFEGVGLTMIFDPRTGDVAFDDRPGFQYEGFGGGSSQRQGLTFNFDLNDGMHRRHGSDPRQAERRWLMSRTQSYRESAQDQAAATQAETASRSVRGRLQRILDDEARPIASRRARIFATWDLCSESDAGASARRSIIAFIRERLPQGSANAFTSAEIASFNARRRSAEPFAPY